MTATLSYSLATVKEIELEKVSLLTCKILGVPFNTSAANQKYLADQRENLTIPIHMHLSQKQKTFSQFFVQFWNLD